MRKRAILGIFWAFLLIFSLGMKVDDVPNPQTERSSFVQDSAGVLGPEYIRMIDNIAQQLESTTGAELAVVTVDNLEGISVEEFAVRLFQRFGVGKKEQDNGVLILFSLFDRKVRIEVGYGLEGILTDAYTSRIIREDGIPYFKQKLYGQGLFTMARQVALRAAQEDDKELNLPLPSQWPPQVEVVVKAPSPTSAFTKKKGVLSIPRFLMALLGVVVLLIFYKAIRFKRAEAKAVKQKILNGFYVIPLFMWVGGGIGAFLIGGILNHVWAAVLPFVGTSAGMSLAYSGLKKYFAKFLGNYHLTCKKCHSPMELVGEKADNSFLMKEEVAEERVGGMDYEFWVCPQCKNKVRFDVKLYNAKACPQCSRRTLLRTSSVMSPASTSHSGTRRITEKCHNPKCKYNKSWTQTIPKVASSSSSGGWSSGGGSFGGGSSGGGSFGGGSSGGGGASGGW